MGEWPFGDGGRWQGGGAVTGSTTGTTITASATANTKPTTWTEVLAATTYEGMGLLVSVVDNSAAARYLLDIGIGASGVEQTLVPDLHLAYPRANQAGQAVFLPIRIPAGSRISARCQSSTASATLAVLVGVVAAGFTTGPVYGRVTAYGVAASSSAGTTVDPGGTAHTATKVQIVSSTENPIKALIVGIGQRANTAMTTCRWLWRVLVGASGSEVEVVPWLGLASNTTDDDVEPSYLGPLPVPAIPAGSQLVVEAQCSITDATDRLLDAVLYGLD